MSLRSAWWLSMLASAVLAGAARGQPCTDTDGDGACDPDDDCVALFQSPAQFCDVDQDGYGNFCDGDWNGDGFVGGEEWGFATLLEMSFGKSGSYVTDYDCDGVVGIPDWAIFWERMVGRPVGPSGLSCAGTVPCP
jgi:hypothetical protein